MKIDALYRKATDGDHDAEVQLFQYLSDRFRLFVQLRISNKQDSEDIVQNALMTINSKYRDIDFRTSFAAWAYKVLENKLRDYYKGPRKRESRMDSATEHIGAGGSTELDPTTRRLMLDCLRKVGEANIRFARALNLHYQGYATEEICRKLQLTRNYFYVVLSRARSMLSSCLENGDITTDE